MVGFLEIPDNNVLHLLQDFPGFIIAHPFKLLMKCLLFGIIIATEPKLVL